MRIGTHNSWSYGNTQWYMPSFVCRCQSLDIISQYIRGSRVFDLRLRWNFKKNIWQVAHGPAIFDVNYLEDLKFLDEVPSDVWVRVILEYNSIPKKINFLKTQFIKQCKYLEETYKNIKFFGGRLKCTWSYIYIFKNDVELEDKYSSTTSWFKSSNYFLRILDDWWPWLYAFRHNKINYINFRKNFGLSNKCLFIDFIEYI